MYTLTAHRNRIDPEQIHDVLRNDRRRRVLEYLKQRLEPVSVRDLSEWIATHEAGTSPAPSDVRKSVYNSLNQTHLPKLDDIGIVHYERDRKVVSLCEGARDVEIYMGVVNRLGITWGTYYRTLGVVALLSIVLAEAEAFLLAEVEPLLFATVFLFVFALSGAYQVWTRRWFYLHSLFGTPADAVDHAP